MIGSFIFFLVVFLAVGLLSARVRKNTRKDYYLAGLEVKPWLVGLSAMATNLSGYMFIGLIGFTHKVGLSSVWLMFGWIIGDLLVSLFIHRPLREQTEKQHQLSYAGVLANWHGQNYWYVEKIAALLLIFLLMSYASAQMLAGSKALLALLEWPLETGVIVSAVMIALYCWAGGIRASVWTDAAHAIVMVIAMAIMLWIGFDNQGGLTNAIHKWREIDGYMAWFPKETLIPGAFGATVFAIGWFFGGISIIGQPHIMIRFMMLDNVKHFIRARVWYYTWYTVFYALAVGVGMLSRLIMPDMGGFNDAELALPLIAQELLPPVLVGVVLAGLFAATMSTADSLVLSASSAITQDLKDEGVQDMKYVKGTTIIVTLTALLFALHGSESVFAVVMFAWSGLGSSFAPLLIVYVLGGRPTQAISVTMMCGGLTVAVLWRYLEWQNHIYEGLPGIITGLLIFAVWAGSKYLLAVNGRKKQAKYASR